MKIGQVARVVKGDYGFLSTSDNVSWYFKMPPFEVKESDYLVFEANEAGENKWATRLRKPKVKVNNHGLVFIYPWQGSHIHEGVEPYLNDVLDNFRSADWDIDGNQVDFNRTIGYCSCVQTEEADKISYHIRKERRGHSRFVHNKEPIPCSSIVVILGMHDNFFQIKTAYIVLKSFPEPFSPLATEEALIYWRNHAFVFGTEKVLEHSGLDECPWQLKIPSVSHIRP